MPMGIWLVSYFSIRRFSEYLPDDEFRNIKAPSILRMGRWLDFRRRRF